MSGNDPELQEALMRHVIVLHSLLGRAIGTMEAVSSNVPATERSILEQTIVSSLEQVDALPDLYLVCGKSNKREAEACSE